ncbi:hypothetical protein GC167_05635 [bacterium]|nr:hypothetical protein [bacterium]
MNAFKGLLPVFFVLISIWKNGQEINASQHRSDWQLSLLGSFVDYNRELVERILELSEPLSRPHAEIGFGLAYRFGDFTALGRISQGTSKNSNSNGEVLLGTTTYDLRVGYVWEPWGLQSVRCIPFVGYQFQKMDFTVIHSFYGGTRIPKLPSYFVGYSDQYGMLGFRCEAPPLDRWGNSPLFPTFLGFETFWSGSFQQALWNGSTASGVEPVQTLQNGYWSLGATLTWSL